MLLCNLLEAAPEVLGRMWTTSAINPWLSMSETQVTLPRDEVSLQALLKRAREGDSAAYGGFLEELLPRVRAFHKKALGRFVHLDVSACEDLTQETLLAVHSQLASYRAESSLMSWVLAIARYKFVDFLRARGAKSNWETLDELIDLSARVQDPAVAHDLKILLTRLSKRDAELLSLVKIQGESVAEAADKLDMTEGAAKVAIHRAMKTLAEEEP